MYAYSTIDTYYITIIYSIQTISTRRLDKRIQDAPASLCIY